MPLASTLLPALLGLGTGLSLIVAIGAQNAYVLRLGIAERARVVLPVVVLCALSDAVLITAGTLGIGVVVQRAPAALVVVRVVGAGFLVVYGLLAARRALAPRGEALTVADGSATVADGSSEAGTGGAPAGARVRTALLTVAAFTWLNPHVYLDTVVFLGSVANQQGPSQRWWWVGGAILASVVWFFALGFGARLLRPVFARPAAWRVLDGAIAVVMVAIAVELAFGV